MLPVFAVACGNPEAETTALDLTNLDTSVSPAEDFYGFATGGWQKKNPLKPEYSRYGVMDILSENNQKRLNDLFAGLDSIRDCIAFPKNNSGRDVMLDAPSVLDQKQLDELKLDIRPTEE